MRVNTTTTDRKDMAHALAVVLHVGCRYTGVPRCAYQVGQLFVERDGSIEGEPAELAKVSNWLLSKGLITEGITIQEEQPTEENQEQPAETEAAPEAEQIQEQPAEEETEQIQEQPDAPEAEQDESHVCIQTSLANHTPAQILNVFRILYAQQVLIRKMTLSDGIAIDRKAIDAIENSFADNMEALTGWISECTANGWFKGLAWENGTLAVAFTYDENEPTRWTHYAELLNAIIRKADQAVRVRESLETPEDGGMKYTCRNFLLQLNLGGTDFKAMRAALLNHLTGYSAFKTAAKMDAHKEKYAEIRRQQREAAR